MQLVSSLIYLHACHTQLVLLTGVHARIQELLPGVGGSRPDCQKNSCDNVGFFCCFDFSPQLILQIYYGCPMVISKKTIIFQGFRGAPTFSREVSNFFQGVQMLISIETHITCDFPSGGVWICTCGVLVPSFIANMAVLFWNCSRVCMLAWTWRAHTVEATGA